MRSHLATATALTPCNSAATLQSTVGDVALCDARKVRHSLWQGHLWRVWLRQTTK
jgi:hypothetical protein